METGKWIKKRSKYSSCQSASCFLTSWGTCSLAWKVFQSLEVMTVDEEGERVSGRSKAGSHFFNVELTEFLSLDESILDSSSDSISALLLVSVCFEEERRAKSQRTKKKGGRTGPGLRRRKGAPFSEGKNAHNLQPHRRVCIPS